MSKYSLEFILHSQHAPLEEIHGSVESLGEGLEILDCRDDTLGQGKNFIVRVFTDEPTLIFDTCAQFGRIKSMKVQEIN